jgi:hypothetical protein
MNASAKSWRWIAAALPATSLAGSTLLKASATLSGDVVE